MGNSKFEVSSKTFERDENPMGFGLGPFDLRTYAFFEFRI